MSKSWPLLTHACVGVGCVNVQMRIPFSSNQLANSTRHWVICILILGVLTTRASSPVIKEKWKRSEIKGHVCTTLSTSATTHVCRISWNLSCCLICGKQAWGNKIRKRKFDGELFCQCHVIAGQESSDVLTVHVIFSSFLTCRPSDSYNQSVTQCRSLLTDVASYK